MPKPLTLKRLFLFTLIPGGLYAALFLMRPFWFRPVCGMEPELCTRAGVNGFDQLAFQYGSVFADFCSNIVQNTMGALAFLLPWVLRVPRQMAIRLNLLLLSITAWNGVLLEVVRGLVQRPRPLVYASPLRMGPISINTPPFTRAIRVLSHWPCALACFGLGKFCRVTERQESLFWCFSRPQVSLRAHSG